ncbi:hypothetical protein M0804_002356 [Polistes exclamans]|nr:hypothetical protein M0804_002356 [Polistes exclamans]
MSTLEFEWRTLRMELRKSGRGSNDWTPAPAPPPPPPPLPTSTITTTTTTTTITTTNATAAGSAAAVFAADDAVLLSSPS